MTTAGTTIYKVETVYTVTDKASRGLDDIDKHARGAAQSSETLSSVLKGIGAAVVGSAGISAAKHAFIDFNSKVQESQSQIAGMLALASKTSYTANIERANTLYAELQKRAASLPGTTQEYVEMAGSLTQPIINAGLGMKALGDMTVNTVVAAKALRVEAGAAARDVDQALRGQYHSVDQFTGKLLGSMGYAGEEGRSKFNALSAAKRAAELQKAIMQPQIAEMAAAQGASFTGVMSTLEDSVEQTLGKVGRPLFKAITAEITNWNRWLDANSEKIDHIVESVGEHLVSGFETVKDLVAWIVDHSDTLLAIGKVWAGGKLAGALMGGLQGTIGNIAGAFGKAATTSSVAGSLPGLATIGTTAFFAGTELAKLAGTTNGLIDLLDPQAMKYKKLVDSMSTWDEALAASKRGLQTSTQSGATATDVYAKGLAVSETILPQKIAQLEAHQKMEVEKMTRDIFHGFHGGLSMDKAKERAQAAYAEKFPEKIAMLEKARDDRHTLRERMDLAAASTTRGVDAVMATLTQAQNANIDTQRATETVMRRWWAHMGDIMATNPDGSPVVVPLLPMFHLD